MRSAWILTIGLIVGLISLPGFAQSPDPTPDQEPVGRDHIVILTSTLERAFTNAVAERVTKKTSIPIDVRTVLANPAIKDFCQGIGLEYADIVAVPRRITRYELKKCIENHVLDLVELKVGFDALVIATKKGDPVFNITPRQVYYGLAAEIPHHLNFVPNPANNWKDVDSKLPDLEIRVIGPATGTVILNFMKDIFMEGGCRGLSVFKIYYNAADRVRQCTTMRADGRFMEIKAPIAINFLEPMRKSPRGTLAVIPFTVWLKHQNEFDVLPVSGMLPSNQSINDDDYDAVYPVRFYVKRANMAKQLGGNGSVPGLYAFIQEITSEEAMGPNGYLEQLGLVTADPTDREENRKAALRLDRFSRN